MEASQPLVLDHVLNPDHDALRHSAVFEAADGNFFCLHCAVQRYKDAPNFRRLALLDGIRCIISAQGVQPSLRAPAIDVDACLPMLLQGLDSADASIVQAATDIMLALKEDLDHPVGVLASLVSSALSLGLPRAAAHLYLIGQITTFASHDRALAAILGNACFGRCDDQSPHQIPLPFGARAGTGGESRGRVRVPGRGRGDATESGVEGEERLLGGFGSFLAAHAVSTSCPDEVKSDVLYVAMELLDCCMVASMTSAPQDPPLPPPDKDPFVSVMLAIPRLLTRRSSRDEPLQLHSIAYLATATTYCRLRTAMFVPGWSSNPAGVPEVLVTLFDGARQFAPREVLAVGEGSGAQASSGGLVSTLKTLLMSSSYRVRSATARLITSLCSDDRFSEESAVPRKSATAGGSGGGGGGSNGGGLFFFREVLIAAGTTDFLFEAIKSEREGSPRHYLEALEAFALSPMEFFHADNFSIKLASRVLLDASRDGDGGGTHTDRDDEAAVFSLSSRLLLHALVTVPPSGGVVEELLATAAVSTRIDTPNKTRSVELAADVLSLVASGDIALARDRGSFVDAVRVLLDHLEEDLECAAPSDSLQTPVEEETAASSAVVVSADQSGSCQEEEERRDDGGLVLQCARVYASLLHTAEEWASSQGTALGRPPFGQAERRGAKEGGCFRGKGEEEEGEAFVDLVLAAYERTLCYQFALIARSENLGHDVAFLSCLGAAVDVASSVLFQKRRRREEAVARGSFRGSSGTGGSQLLLVRPSFVGALELDQISADVPGDDGRGDGGVGGHGGQGLPASDDAGAASSCLETILRVAVEADVVSWVLDFYVRCGASAGGARTDSLQTPEKEGEGSQDDGGGACGAATRELLLEVLLSILYAQGWVNGLCDHDAGRPFQQEGDPGGDGGAGSNAFSSFEEAVRLVVQSWTASSVSSGGEEVVPLPLDQHALSLLGTNADGGDLCKLVALLVSLSPSFLGMLHPHGGCRVDSAVTLLRYVKSLPEAVFSLNLFSHIVLLTGSDESRGGLGGKWRLPPGLGGAVKDLLARFPVGELALSLIPLSSLALSLSLLAGGEGFVADWLVAAPLARITRAIGEFGGLRGGERAAGDAGSDKEQQFMAAADEGWGREALAGVLEAALRRWGLEIENSLQRKSSDAVIHRLACVLLMSPDTFLSLVFDEGLQSMETPDREQRRRQELSRALRAVIPETLESLSALLSPVVSRRGDGSNATHRTSQLACASQVSRLASAFLRARCAQGFYAPVGAGSVDCSAALSPGRESPEVSLARACGGLLQGVLDPRLGQGSTGGGGGGDSVHRALLAVLNLLNALLVIVGGDAGLLRQEKDELALALEESHAALSEVLATTAVAAKRLTGWLDYAPDTLAAFLQACVLSNAVESSSNGFGDGSNRNRLNIPFQVLGDVLSVGGGPCDAVIGGGGGGGSVSRPSQTRAPLPTPRRAVRRSLLKVLALRCIESTAYTRFFSREEVLALQLTLQGVACDGSAVLASAAHGALQALWEAYAGLVPSADLVGQSWNTFMVECSLENALRSLSRDQEGRVNRLRLASDSMELRVDAPVLVSTIGRLLRWSAGKMCARLSHSKCLGDGGSSLEVLSETAAVSIYKCAALVAKKLCVALGDGMGQQDDRQLRDRGMGDNSSSSRSSGCSEYRFNEDTGIGDSVFHLSDALVQVLPVLTYMEPLPQENLVAGAGARRKLADALSSLHPELLRLREARPCLKQVSMPLSSGAYHDCAADCSALNSYEGVLFVRHDNWRSFSSPMEPVSFEGLAGEIERFVGRFSKRRPGAGTRTEDKQDRREGQDGGSNAMMVDVI